MMKPKRILVAEYFAPYQKLPSMTDQSGKRVGVTKNGRGYIYKNHEAKAIRARFRQEAAAHAPDTPSSKTAILSVIWCYHHGKKHKAGEPKLSKPDTDNLLKLLKDAIADAGYWKDDSYVYEEHSRKIWDDREGIYIRIEEEAV